MAAFREMNWRALNAIVSDKNNCSARLFAASVLMAVNVNDVIDVNVQDISPIKAFVDGFS